MRGRIKFLIRDGNAVRPYPYIVPEIPYEYEQPTAYDASCGTYDVPEFQLPNQQFPSKFVCDAPESIYYFSRCIE